MMTITDVLLLAKEKQAVIEICQVSDTRGVRWIPDTNRFEVIGGLSWEPSLNDLIADDWRLFFPKPSADS